MSTKTFVSTATLLSAASLGFSFFWLTSHPTSRLKGKIPSKKYKNFSLLPNVQYHRNDTTYHFHHWAILLMVYFPLLTSRKLRKSHAFHGLFLGSIVQGLLYKDRLQFRFPKGD